MIIFKNGFPIRTFLELNRRRREYKFLIGSKNYGSIGKVHLSQDSPTIKTSKGKVYSTTLLKLYYDSQSIPSKILFENSSQLKCTQVNKMANNFMKIEIQKISNCPAFTKFNPLCHNHSNNASIKLGNRNYKVHLTRNTNCRFYSQVSIENFTFGEHLFKNKNNDSFVNDYPLGKDIPSYMLTNFSYPSLAICTEECEKEIAHSQNNRVKYYSFELKDISSVAETKEKEIYLTSFQNSGTQISSNNIEKKIGDLSTFYEHYFSSSKVYFVKCNKIEGENDVKIKTMARHLYPLNRKPVMLMPDPVLKYLNLFITKQEAIKNKDNKLCLTSAENRDPSSPNSRIREKPVPRDQLPLDINPNTHSIVNIINSIDRSEAIIHKDLYITNRVVDLLKKEDKKKGEKNPMQAKNEQSLSTNSRLDTTKVDQILATASYIETSKSYDNKPQSYESTEITEKESACSTSQDMSKRNEPFFVVETTKKIDNTNTTDKLSSYDEAENNLMAEYSNDGCISETKKDMDKIPFSKYSDSNAVENFMSQVIAIKSSDNVNEYSLYKNKHLADDYSRKSSKVILSEHGASGMVSVEKLSSQNNLVKSVIVSGSEEKISEQDDVSRKESNPVIIHPKVEEINNHSDSRSITNIPNLKYPPTFVDNIVSNLRNPTSKKTQATTSQCRGSHSNSSNERDGTVDVLTETSITSTKFGKKAKIQIHEVQTYKDGRLPIKFTTDTLMEMQGSNEKLKAATEVVEVAKAKLVLSRSNADADVKSGVESAIKLADLISFLKHKVMVGNGLENSKIPIQIDPQIKEIKSLTREYTPKSVNSPDTKTTNLPNLSGKPKQRTTIQKTKTIFPEVPKKRNYEKVKTVNLQDKSSDSKAKTDEVNKVADTQPTNKVSDKNKKPEDEVKVIKVKSHDLKKILNRSDNTEHSIHIINKIEKTDVPKKNKRKSNKHYAEKKKKKFTSTKKMENPQEMRKKKIMEIKPVVEDALKKEPVERKTTKPLQNFTESGKKPNEVDLTDRDLKILENIKKGSGGTPSSSRDTATVPSKETSKKLKNIKGENKDLLKDMISNNNANIKRDPVTYDVIKIAGDEAAKAKSQKFQKKKNIIIIAGEKEGNQDKKAFSVQKRGFKESNFKSEDTEKVEMVAVKVHIKNDNDFLQSYKNVFIKKRDRNPLVIRKSIPKLTDPNKPFPDTNKKVGESLAKARDKMERDKLRHKKSDKLDRKTISDQKKHSKEMEKFLLKEKLSDKKITNYKKSDVSDDKVSQNIKERIEKNTQKDSVSEKKSAKSSQIITPAPKKTDVSAKDTQNVSSKKMASQLEKKDIEEVAGKKPATKVSEPSEIIPPISKKPVSVKKGKSVPNIKDEALEMKRGIKKENEMDKVVDKKPATKLSEPSEIIPPISKKPVSVKKGKSIPSIKDKALEMKRGIKKENKIDKVVDKKVATKLSKPSKIIPPISKKPVSVKKEKSIPSIKDEALEKKKDRKSASDTSKISSPVVKKSKISPKDDKNIGKASLQEKKKYIRQDVVSGKPSPVSKKPDITTQKEKTSKESKLNEQPQKTDSKTNLSGVSNEFTSRRSSEKAADFSKSEIKEKKPAESLKRKTPDPSTSPVYSSTNLPVSFAKSKSVAMSGDLFIDLDKLSKETKPALDARSAMRIHVPIDKLMEFPLINAHKTLQYGRPKEGITCLDCKKDPILRQKLKTIPSVTRVLNATMSDSSRIALAKWRTKMVADLGEAGFQEFYKGQIESGTEFHEKIQKHFSGFSQDLVNSPNPALRSVSTVSKHISEVSVVESHVIHNRLAYRGIIDCVAKYDNKPVMIEWKRSDKKKKLIQSTFDAPLQLCAYIGALNYDSNYQMQVQGGVVVVAYSDGSPADVFTIPLEECQKYWKQWLSRLKMYLLDDYGK